MTDNESTPKVLRTTRLGGVAGTYGIAASVLYPYESTPETVTFQSSAYGPPIVMVTPGNPGGTFVSRSVLDRIGSTLDENWVRAFFA